MPRASGLLTSVGLIFTRLGPTVKSEPLTHALIGGAQPKKRLVGPCCAAPYRRGGGMASELTRFIAAATVPTRPKP